MNKTIEVVVAPNGKTHVETKGFFGSECRQASEFIEQALGEREHEQLKAELHQVQSPKVVQEHS